jgi:hypothetical protein
MPTDQSVSDDEASNRFPDFFEWSRKEPNIPRWSPLYSIFVEVDRLLGDPYMILYPDAPSNQTVESKRPARGQGPECQEDRENTCVEYEVPYWSSMYSACAEVQHFLGDDPVKLYERVKETCPGAVTSYNCRRKVKGC